LLFIVVAHTKIFLVQNEDIKDICLALPCLDFNDVYEVDGDVTGTTACSPSFMMLMT
jgi:hypothetical protein